MRGCGSPTASPGAFSESPAAPRGRTRGFDQLSGFRAPRLDEYRWQSAHHIECKSVYAATDLQRSAKRYQVGFTPNPYMKDIDFAELCRGALIAIDDGSEARKNPAQGDRRF
jgi:hypothetical protein